MRVWWTIVASLIRFVRAAGRGALLAVAVAISSPIANAQNGTPVRRSVTGTVFDSLVANAPLVGAEVSVEGTELTAMTDAQGRFHLDSVPAGRAVVRFYHPTLDSLGFGAAPIAVTVSAGASAVIRLATPSPTTLHARLCPGRQPQSTGVLLGRIRNVDGHASLPSAEVSVRWGEWTVGNGALTRAERRVTATSDSSGAYLLCGVPTDVAVVARASAADHVTGLVEVDLSQRLFDVRDFAVSVNDSGATTTRLAQLDSMLARGDSIASTGSVVVTGSVRAPDGKPVPDAQVALFGFPVAVRSNADGQFRLVGVPAGSQTIEVRAVGFAPQRRTFELATGERRTIEIATVRAAQTLASVNIVGRGARVDMTGFEERRKAGIGRFIGPEEIERRRVFDTSQLLWNVPGSRVVWNGSDNVVMFTRPFGTGVGGGGFNDLCNPAIFVDGFQVYDMNDVRPYDVRGIEVYPEKSSAPAQYRASSLKDSGLPDTHCAVILVWTKPRAAKGQAKPKP